MGRQEHQGLPNSAPPQQMAFIPQGMGMDMTRHYGMVATPNFAMSPSGYGGQPGVAVSSVQGFFPFQVAGGTYMPVARSFQVTPGKQNEMVMLTERMGDMRFQEGREQHYVRVVDVGYPSDGRATMPYDPAFQQQQQQQQQQQRPNYHMTPKGEGSRGKGSNNNHNNNNKQLKGWGQQPLQQQQPQQQRRPQKGMEDKIKRTIYISSIDLKITEAELASFFLECGQVVDCRICGDPNMAMRFAFIEFKSFEGAQRAIAKSGVMLMDLPLRILPSKTAILPVSKDLMPRSQEDIERCSRTVYVSNIDKKVNREDVRRFFEELCGKVSKLRLLGDYAHPTRIAFLEFVLAEGAMAALDCSGAVLGSLPLRVSPSKTPVRPDMGQVSQEAPRSSSSQQLSEKHDDAEAEDVCSTEDRPYPAEGEP